MKFEFVTEFDIKAAVFSELTTCNVARVSAFRKHILFPSTGLS